MAKKKETKKEKVEVPVVETPVVETPKPKKVEPKKPTWEVRDRVYKLKGRKRPFLHVRYRASETESRKMKTCVTGSVGAATSGKDVMEVHYLSERCLITQGANNFMLMN